MGILKGIYTELHGPRGRKSTLRRQAKQAEELIREQIRMSFTTDAEFRDWELQSTRRRFGQCTACPLHRQRSCVVHGNGNTDPLLLLVGSAPHEGSHEPYDPVTREGRLLRGCLRRLGYDLDRDAWVTHVVACATPDRRRLPTAEERGACKRGRLSAEVSITRPRVILLLGDAAVRQVLLGVSRSATVAEHAGLVPKGHWPLLELGTCGTARLRAVFATHDPGEVLAARGSRRKAMMDRLVKDLRNVKRVVDKLNEKRAWR